MNRLSLVLLVGCVAVHGLLATGLIAAGFGFPVLGVAQYPVIDMSSVTTTTATGGVDPPMAVSGTVRYGDWSTRFVPGGPSLPGYVKGGPVRGLDVVAYLVTGVNAHGFPVLKVLAKTTTDDYGQYLLVFKTNSTILDKYVLVQALNQYGEARKVLVVQAGAFSEDMVFSFENTLHSLLPFSTVRVQWGQSMFFIDDLWIPGVVASWIMGTVGLILRKRT